MCVFRGIRSDGMSCGPRHPATRTTNSFEIYNMQSPQDRLAYYRFLYVTVSSPLTCDWLRFSCMRISAISRCAVFEIPFSL